MSVDYVSLKRMPEEQVLIYAIEHVCSGKMYVGSTVEPKRRWRNHQSLLKNNKHTSFLLQRSWNKHSKEGFVFKPLMVCSKTTRDMYEKILINTLGSFNLLKEVGVPPAGSMAGKTHTEQAKRNLKKGALARWRKSKEEVYDPLCLKAYELSLTGVPRYKACVQIGISHSTFWNWLRENDLLKRPKK